MSARPSLQQLGAARGFVPAYRPGCACPACTGSNWWLGRQSAECAFCGAVLPLGPVRAAALHSLQPQGTRP